VIESPDLRLTKMPLNGAGCMPTLGFGTLIPDTAVAKTATRDALDAGFRHFDCAEPYRNEREVGEYFCDQEVMELQPSARTSRTGFRGESRQTQTQVSGSLPHSHSICIW
jgi:predicted aldo/keto reductase-like oxidoreductase